MIGVNGQWHGLPIWSSAGLKGHGGPQDSCAGLGPIKGLSLHRTCMVNQQCFRA